jgi:hypothetical protein
MRWFFRLDVTNDNRVRSSGKRLRSAPQAAFGINVAFGFIAWGMVAARYIRPELHRQPRVDALRTLLALHSFRFIGLAFLVPGVVSPELPTAFARQAAYGDLVAAVLALVSSAGLKSRFGPVLVWVFSVWGTADLLNAFYQGYHFGFPPGRFGAAYFIVTFMVPLLLITHALIVRLLLQDDRANAVESRAPAKVGTR